MTAGVGMNNSQETHHHHLLRRCNSIIVELCNSLRNFWIRPLAGKFQDALGRNIFIFAVPLGELIFWPVGQNTSEVNRLSTLLTL